MEASMIIPLACWILSSCFAIPQASGVTFKGSPEMVMLPFTQSLTLNCSLNISASTQGRPVVGRDLSTNTASSDVEFIDALIITRNDGVEIASITRQNMASASINAHNLKVRGSISGTAGSDQFAFLELMWTDPTENNTGVYECKANSINTQGHDIVYSSSVKIGATEPSIRDVISQLHNLQVDYRRKVATLEAANAKLECDFKNQVSKSAVLEAALFNTSAEFLGHRYYLTTHLPSSWSNAEKVCNAMGGYIAEIDTKDEFEFIKSFIPTSPTNEQVVLLGGTEAGHLGVWKNRNSSAPVGYTAWNKGEPNHAGGNEHCQALDRHSGWLMNDIPCDFKGLTVFYENWKYAYLCEVPIASDVNSQVCNV